MTSFDFMSLAHSGVQHLKPYQPGKPMAELERELGISNSLKLASNENPLGASPKAVEAIINAANGVEIYPDGNGFQLKQALAEKLSVEAAVITLGNGSNEILELLARVFLWPGKNAVFSQHAFAVYPLVTQAVGAELRIADALPDSHAQPYGHDLNAMLSLIDENTGLVFIANPNNPTGTWITESELREFLQQVPEHVIVVLDEAYCEYVQMSEYPNGVFLMREFDNLLVTRTFSKIYGLAGLRIGYGISNAAIADALNRARQPFNTNLLAQVAAVAALADDEFVVKSCEVNNQGLALIENELLDRGLPCIPSVGNFISFMTKRPAADVYNALLRETVIVRPIDNYGFPNGLRVTIGNAEQNKIFLTALDQVLHD